MVSVLAEPAVPCSRAMVRRRGCPGEAGCANVAMDARRQMCIQTVQSVGVVPSVRGALQAGGPCHFGLWETGPLGKGAKPRRGSHRRHRDVERRGVSKKKFCDPHNRAELAKCRLGRVFCFRNRHSRHHERGFEPETVILDTMRGVLTQRPSFPTSEIARSRRRKLQIEQ